MRSASKLWSRLRKERLYALVRVMRLLAGLESPAGQPVQTTAVRIIGGPARMKLRQSSSTNRPSGSK
eukprot:10008146-Alexandrium_andersonii.AAC.1